MAPGQCQTAWPAIASMICGHIAIGSACLMPSITRSLVPTNVGGHAAEDLAGRNPEGICDADPDIALKFVRGATVKVHDFRSHRREQGFYGRLGKREHCQ